MRKIAATYIFTSDRRFIRNGLLICDDNGTVNEIVERDAPFREEAGTEFYSGLLVPGFVNAHCHLELSHLHGQIGEKTGIGGFIGEINRLRNTSHSDIHKAMRAADRKMHAAGIAAVGDISNTMSSLKVKQKSAIRYHTFVETFGFHPERAERAFQLASNVKKLLDEAGLPASIVPHSPYSVSGPLFKKIAELARSEKSTLSIHNQESEGETQFYRDGSGPIAEHLQNNLGIDISHWEATGKSSLQAILDYLPAENSLLLVHNTFTAEEDIKDLLEKRAARNTYLVLCPQSNLYIENALPPLALFKKFDLNICLGTDSLASNHALSVLQEMLVLQTNFPETPLQDLLIWASINGACALGFENELGSFEKGKKPGVNLLTGLDLKQMKLTAKTRVKRLL